MRLLASVMLEAPMLASRPGIVLEVDNREHLAPSCRSSPDDVFAAVPSALASAGGFSASGDGLGLGVGDRWPVSRRMQENV